MVNKRKRRKEYVIYPLGYEPGDRYKMAKSVLQAKKTAYKYYPQGAEICVAIHTKGPMKGCEYFSSGFQLKALFNLEPV